MRWSTQTLQDVWGSLPARFQNAYQTPLVLTQANAVLAEIEKLCDPDFLVKETAILLKDGVTDYVYPDSSIRRVRGLFSVQPGEVVPDHDSPIPFQELGTRIRLGMTPTVSGVADITGTVDAAGPSGLSLVFDNTAGILDILDDDALTSRLCRVTHASGAIENRIIVGNDPAAFTIALNGDLEAAAATGDTYLVTSDYVIVEFSRYMNRFTAMATVLDLPTDYEEAFKAGLFYRAFRQIEIDGDEAKMWGKIYGGLLSDSKDDASTQASITNFVRRPNRIPDFQ